MATNKFENLLFSPCLWRGFRFWRVAIGCSGSQTPLDGMDEEEHYRHGSLFYFYVSETNCHTENLKSNRNATSIPQSKLWRERMRKKMWFFLIAFLVDYVYRTTTFPADSTFTLCMAPNSLTLKGLRSKLWNIIEWLSKMSNLRLYMLAAKYTEEKELSECTFFRGINRERERES